ncbi:MAG: hypothetical protein ACYSUX_17700 [Planctomycetota bacterium]|jgi:hypothetical protein
MKESPQTRNLEQILRSSKMAAGGFMGSDSRSVAEIIDADAFEVSKTGYTAEQLSARMQEITNAAIKGLGTWVEVDDNHQAIAEEARGSISCPWPHLRRYAKRVTTVKCLDTGQIIRWTDLNIHFIAQHGFFEGRGSAFRIEPGKLTKTIF